ncbi:MAG: hypothetical protein ACFB11_07070 [Paracoccaceae bacterium]
MLYFFANDEEYCEDAKFLCGKTRRDKLERYDRCALSTQAPV